MDKSVPAGAAKLLAFIGSIEAPKGYDTVYGNNQDKLPKPLTSMTIDEVLKAGPGWTKGFGSSAAGFYQFMRATLTGLKKELKLTGKEKLDRNMQDRLAFHLLKRRSYEDYAAGRIDRTEFGKRLAMEWASLPVLAAVKGRHKRVLRGHSYYEGDKLNKSLVKPERVEAVLDEVIRIARGASVIVEKKVVADPGELETPPSKSKTVWTWLLTAIGAPLAAFGNLDWRVQMVIVAAIVGFAVYGIKRRNDLFKAVRSLKEELS